MGYTVTRNGRVTLPKRARTLLGVEPGQQVDFRLNGSGEVVVEKSGAGKSTGQFTRWRGFFGTGLSTDEVMALSRGE